VHLRAGTEINGEQCLVTEWNLSEENLRLVHDNKFIT
jgi:hypothetical protein